MKKLSLSQEKYLDKIYTMTNRELFDEVIDQMMSLTTSEIGVWEQSRIIRELEERLDDIDFLDE